MHQRNWSAKNFLPNITHVKGVKLFRIKFSENYYPSYAATSILLDPYHILRPRTISRWLARPRVGLWMDISCNPLSSSWKAVARNWGRRRTQSALLEEFRKRGLDKDGKRLPGTNGKGLCGSLHLLPNSSLLKADFRQVRREMKTLVDWLEWRAKNLHHVNKNDQGQLSRSLSVFEKLDWPDQQDHVRLAGKSAEGHILMPQH